VKVRNPISSLAATLVTAFGLSLLVAIPTLFLPIVELRYFLLPFALFGVGLLAGRSSFIGGLGFAGSLIGGFAGSLLFQYLAWATGWELLIALGLGAACGLGGMATGKLGLRRVEKAVARMPRLRRCQRCGARVGLSARKCWSCKGYLPPT